jgi:glutaredoxin
MKNSLGRLLLVFAFLAGCSGLPPADLSVKAPSTPEDVVVVYIRTGCPFCEQTLELLRQNEVVPEVRDVSRDRTAYQELRAIYREHFPGEGVIVPVLAKNRTYLRGFNRQSIIELVNHSRVTPREDYESCEEAAEPQGL